MINVLKYRLFAALFSATILVGFGFVYFQKSRMPGRESAFLYSVDFTGGTQVLLNFDKPVSLSQLKTILEEAGWSNPILREFKATEMLVRVKEFSGDAKGVAGRMVQAVAKALPEIKVQDRGSEAVGAGIGAELRWKAMRAVLISLLALLLYIAFSFWSFAFAFGAVVALAHDALIILSSLLFFDREISITVIGAVLAVLGYSINDTIVIFSRIRQNMKTMKGAPVSEIINVSINSTLRRTMLTSLSTMLVILAMVFLGGEVLRDFSLTLLLGVVFGTYSSIYIASPIMMLFHRGKTS